MQLSPEVLDISLRAMIIIHQVPSPSKMGIGYDMEEHQFGCNYEEEHKYSFSCNGLFEGEQCMHRICFALLTHENFKKLTSSLVPLGKLWRCKLLDVTLMFI